MNLRRFIMLLLVAASVCAAPAISRAEDARQYKIEAAYLYNFLNYITWPNNASPEMLKQATICLLPDEPVKSYLEYVKEKFAAERTLTIRELADGQSSEGCHILFMRRRLPDDIQNTLGPDTLTVSDFGDTLERREMIGLNQQDERVTIDINQPMLTKNGFKVSSRLLDLAQRMQ